MPDFQVESYRVRTRRATAAAPARRTIFLLGVALAHGIRNKALLRFRESSSLPASLGDVSNVGGLNFDGEFATAYFHTSDFEDTYKILQTEKPVNVFYEYTPSGGESRQLSFMEIGTFEEPVGEEET